MLKLIYAVLRRKALCSGSFMKKLLARRTAADAPILRAVKGTGPMEQKQFVSVCDASEATLEAAENMT